MMVPAAPGPIHRPPGHWAGLACRPNHCGRRLKLTLDHRDRTMRATRGVRPVPHACAATSAVTGRLNNIVWRTSEPGFPFA